MFGSPFWHARIGAVAVVTAGGFTSMLHHWMGGAGAPPTVAASGGVRSMCHFWMGGAGNGPALVVPPSAPTFTGGAGEAIDSYDEDDEFFELLPYIALTICHA